PAEAPARAAAEPARPADAAPAAPSTRERAPGAREPAPARSVTIDAPPRAPAPAAADAEQSVRVTVVDVRTDRSTNATFVTEDGQIWRQIDGRRATQLPDTPFVAEIRPGTLGSFFLRPIDQRRAMRVRRAR